MPIDSQATAPNQDVKRAQGGLDIQGLVCHFETLL